MRVLLTTPYSMSSATGVGSFVRLLVKYLRESDDQVTVLDPDLFPHRTTFSSASLAVRSVFRLLQRRRLTDVVHCQQLHLQSLLVTLVARTLGLSVVLTVHGHSPAPHGIRGLVFHLIQAASLRGPTRLVFVAESLRTELHGRGIVIPNGVDVRAIQGERFSRDAVRRELGIGDAPVIMFLGRVTEDKGILELVGAWESLRRALGRDLHLVLVGPIDGKMAEYFKQNRFPKALHLTGATDTPWRLLAAADLFVLPSTREGLPLSLLEAMAAGIPVIASDVGDVRKLIETDVTGILVPPNDQAALESALRRAILSPDEVGTAARRASELVARGHDASLMGAAYRALFLDLVRMGR